jgi:hypothetical protein
MALESPIDWALKKKGGEEIIGGFPAFTVYFKSELRSV